METAVRIPLGAHTRQPQAGFDSRAIPSLQGNETQTVVPLFRAGTKNGNQFQIERMDSSEHAEQDRLIGQQPAQAGFSVQIRVDLQPFEPVGPVFSQDALDSNFVVAGIFHIFQRNN